MNNKYFLLRHGETIYQTEKKDFLYPWPGVSSPSLTENGEKQIRAVAKELKDRKIDSIYSSDALRTRQTAEIVTKELGLEVHFDERLRDVNWGIYQDGPKEKYAQLFSSREEKFSKRPPKGENWNDVKERVSEVLKEIGEKYKNKNILIVSHGDPLWLLAGIIKGLGRDELLEKKYKGLFPDVGQLMLTE